MMSIDFLYWCGRHSDAIFVTGVVMMGIKCIFDVVGVTDQGVQKYKARASKL